MTNFAYGMIIADGGINGSLNVSGRIYCYRPEV